MTPARPSSRAEIARQLGVRPRIDPAAEVEHRVGFLTDLLRSSGKAALVLGVSGGVDSATAGGLCRRAAALTGAGFVALRLPYHRQHDEADAQLVLDALRPDLVLTIDVGPASDAALAAVGAAGLRFSGPAQEDFLLGNIKARQRMVVQYAVAGALDGLVIGTDHAAEAVTGFFTKHGDGGVDATPLAGLTKRQVRQLAGHLRLPERIVHKTPTADLETLRPQLADEDALGLSYEQIDDFLEGRPVDDDVRRRLTELYDRTDHKRRLPAAPRGTAPA